MSGLSLRRFLLGPAQVLQRSSKIPIRALSEVQATKEVDSKDPSMYTTKEKVVSKVYKLLGLEIPAGGPLVQIGGKLGWEQDQVLAGNNDPWCLESISYPRSNHTKPHIVYTMENYRTVSCTDCMDGQHYENYIIIKVNEMGRCKDCGNCFVVLPHPEPSLIWVDHH